MIRRRKRDDYSPSLFPFLSVLACLIGTLTLMVAAMALGKMNPNNSPDIKQSYLNKLDNVKALTNEKKELYILINEAEKILAQLEIARQEQKQLEKENLEFNKQENLKINRLLEASKLRNEINQLEKEHALLQSKISLYKKDLKEKTKQPKESEIILTPNSNNHSVHRKPYFAECSESSIVLYSDLNIKNKKTINKLFIKSSNDYYEFLNKINRDNNGILVFLIRCDGVEVYRLANEIAEIKNVFRGKVPLIGHGELNFNLLNLN